MLKVALRVACSSMLRVIRTKVAPHADGELRANEV